ncbi:hypothetical protein LJB90_00910 [Eubacteriales bacterium OttesenSCG-928-G02]|nr:hypothetical protein [Eubacteriales bacterium OttesenSCG-928-G02]
MEEKRIKPYKPFNYKVITIPLFIFFLIAVILFSYIVYVELTFTHRINDFNSCKNEFELIKNVAEKQKDKVNEDYFYIIYGYRNNEPYLYIASIKEYITLNSEEKKQLL